MIVDRRVLPHVPTDGDEFVKLGLVDQVARVMLPVPAHIRVKRLSPNWMLFEVAEDLRHGLEAARRKLTQAGNKFVDRNSSCQICSSHVGVQYKSVSLIMISLLCKQLSHPAGLHETEKPVWHSRAPQRTELK